jgi:hypothetical protein
MAVNAPSEILTLLLWHLTVVKCPCITYTAKFSFSPQQRIILSNHCDIQLYSLSYKNALFICIVLPSIFKKMNLYVNVMWLPCLLKFSVFSGIFTLVWMFLNLSSYKIIKKCLKV